MAEVIDCGAFRLYKDSKSPYWQVRAEAAPREPLWKSTKTANETLAKRVAKQIYSEWSAEKKLKPGEQVLFKDLWEQYVEDQATYQKTKTMIRLRSVGKNHLVPAFGNKFLTEVKPLWSIFVRKLKQTRPKSTLFNERKYLLGALNYAHQNGLLDTVPYIPTIAKAGPSLKIFTDDEIRRMLAFCDEVIKTSEIDSVVRSYQELKLQILFGFAMGMRHGEICSIELRHINEKENFLWIEKTKTSIERTIAISDVVWPELKAQINRVRGRSRFLFPQVHNMGKPKAPQVFGEDWQDVKKKLGISGRFHDLRHTCANRLKKSQVSPGVAAAYLGMSMGVFDRTYGRLDKEDTKDAASVVKLPVHADLTVEKSLND